MLKRLFPICFFPFDWFASPSVFVLLVLISVSKPHAQTGCNDELEKVRDNGFLPTVVKLQELVKQCSQAGTAQEIKTEVLTLLAFAHIESDDPHKADSVVVEIVKIDTTFEFNESKYSALMLNLEPGTLPDFNRSLIKERIRVREQTILEEEIIPLQAKLNKTKTWIMISGGAIVAATVSYFLLREGGPSNRRLPDPPGIP